MKPYRVVALAPDLRDRRTLLPHGGVQICPQHVCTHVEPGSCLSHSGWPPGHSGVSPHASTNAVHTQMLPWSVDAAQHWQAELP
jgi:hypothetical protein